MIPGAFPEAFYYLGCEVYPTCGDFLNRAAHPCPANATGAARTKNARISARLIFPDPSTLMINPQHQNLFLQAELV
jgi:hypothetical protein